MENLIDKVHYIASGTAAAQDPESEERFGFSCRPKPGNYAFYFIIRSAMRDSDGATESP